MDVSMEHYHSTKHPDLVNPMNMMDLGVPMQILLQSCTGVPMDLDVPMRLYLLRPVDAPIDLCLQFLFLQNQSAPIQTHLLSLVQRSSIRKRRRSVRAWRLQI